jgi:hypothetical protein
VASQCGLDRLDRDLRVKNQANHVEVPPYPGGPDPERPKGASHARQRRLKGVLRSQVAWDERVHQIENERQEDMGQSSTCGKSDVNGVKHFPVGAEETIHVAPDLPELVGGHMLESGSAHHAVEVALGKVGSLARAKTPDNIPDFRVRPNMLLRIRTARPGAARFPPGEVIHGPYLASPLPSQVGGKPGIARADIEHAQPGPGRDAGIDPGIVEALEIELDFRL